MDFTTKLFETDCTESDDTLYEKELNGAFYDVYVDKDGGFHMAMEDKASLAERIYFYENYFSKERYPVVLDSLEPVEDHSVPEMVFYQSLGLPIDVVTRVSKDGKKYWISSGEILGRIHFESNLHRGYDSLPDHPDQSIFLSNHYSVIGAMNYLIENGIFFQNLERILRPYSEDLMYYPVHIDVRKIPKKYLEVENGAKLFLDFCSNPLTISKEDYLRTFGRVDFMSMEEKVTLAFENPEQIIDKAEKNLRYCLRRYFYSICIGLINEFYQREYQLSILPRTVLSHDFDFSDCSIRKIYRGTVFKMVSLHCYDLKENEDGYDLKEEFSDYRIVIEEENKMALAYQVTKKYFDRHQELHYLPMMFIKMMGLPYPAFEIAKYFDFSKGTFHDFLSLFDECNFSYDDFFVPGGLLSPAGIIEDAIEKEGPAQYYVNHDNRDLFINMPYCLEQLDYQDFLFSIKPKRKCEKAFCDGECNFYQKLIDTAHRSEMLETDDEGNLHQLLTFPVENNAYVPIRDFFRYLNDGYSSGEAYLKIKDMVSLDFSDFLSIVIFALYTMFVDNYLFVNPFRRVFNPFSKDYALRLFVRKLNGKTERYLFSRNSLFRIEEDSKGQISYVLPSSDRWMIPLMNKLCRKNPYDLPISFRYQNSLKLYYSKDDNIGRFIMQTCPLKEVRFDDSLSVFEDPKWKNVIPLIPELCYVESFRKAMKEGIFLFGENDKPRSIYLVDKNVKNADLSYYLNENFVRLLYKGMYYPDSEWRNDDSLNIAGKRDFHKVFRYYMGLDSVDSYNPNENKDLTVFMTSYFGSVQKLYFESLRKGIRIYQNVPTSVKGYSFVVGCIFTAILEESTNTIFFPESDLPLMVSMLNILKQYINKANKASSLDAIVIESGFPPFFYLTLKTMLKSEGNIDTPTLKKYFLFREWKEENTDYVLDAELIVRKQTIQDCYRTPSIRKELMKHGFFCFDMTNLLAISLDDKPDESELSDLLLYFEQNHVAVRNPSGLVKTYLQPNPVFFHELVNDYLMKIYATQFPKELIVAFTDFLFAGYHDYHDFFERMIECLQNSPDRWQAWKDFVRPLTENYPKLKKWNRYLFQECYYLCHLFLLYLEQKLIISFFKNGK